MTPIKTKGKSEEAERKREGGQKQGFTVANVRSGLASQKDPCQDYCSLQRNTKTVKDQPCSAGEVPANRVEKQPPKPGSLWVCGETWNWRAPPRKKAS
jgi:hypothetical protein